MSKVKEIKKKYEIGNSLKAGRELWLNFSVLFSSTNSNFILKIL